MGGCQDPRGAGGGVTGIGNLGRSDSDVVIYWECKQRVVWGSLSAVVKVPSRIWAMNPTLIRLAASAMR